MFALGFILLATAVYLANSAIRNRNPIETLGDIIRDPKNARETWESKNGTWTQPLISRGAESLITTGRMPGIDTSGPGVVGFQGGGSLVAQKAVAYARAQIGKPYSWGAEGPNAFDCSGLIYAAYLSAGKRIPRTTATQIIGGQKVSRGNLLPGDLIFPYPGHVFMYVGDGMCVEAPRTGQNVKYTNIYRFMTARRYA